MELLFYWFANFSQIKIAILKSKQIKFWETLNTQKIEKEKSKFEIFHHFDNCVFRQYFVSIDKVSH